MLALAIMVLGIFAFPRLPVNLLPTFQPPVVSVTVNYGTVSPETMETTITRPIENAVSRVSGIDYLQSDSFQGQTTVRAVFKFGTDINVAAVDIQQQVARAASQLPNDPNLQQPIIQKADPNAIPVVRLYITDTQRALRDLSDLFTNQLDDEFSAVSGVGSVTSGGGQTRAVMIEPNEALLASNGLGVNDIIAKIGKENTDSPAGLAAIGPNEYTIRTNSLYKTAGEIGNTVVAIKNGVPIVLSNVAKITDGIEEQRSFSRLNGKPAISLFISAQPDANIVAVSDGINAKVAALQKRYPSMHFGLVFGQRDFILEAINALMHTAIYGAVLAVLIILLFLHSWRATLIVAVSLPVSVLGTLFAAYALHQSLNVMTLGGLALAVGLIVDDAVVVIENIFRHLAKGESPIDAARNATAQILSAVMASSITVITVFVPLLLIPGLQGLIFGPFALIVMVGVGISLLVALTTVPMLSSFMMRAEDHLGTLEGETPHGYVRFAAGFDHLYDRLEHSYRRVLSYSLDHAPIVLGTGLALFALAFIALKLGAVATEQFPASDSRFVRFDVRTPNGTSLAVTNRVTKLVEDAFMRDKRVTDVGATAGTGFGGGGFRQITNQSLISVNLRPDVNGPGAAAFVNEWQTRLGGFSRKPTAQSQAAATVRSRRTPLTPEQRAFYRTLRAALVGSQVFGRTIDIVQNQVSQGADALQIQLYGPDYNKLYTLAQGVLPQLSTIPGVIRPSTNITAAQPEIDIHVDRRKAAQLGFSTGDIGNIITTATSGTIASYFQVNGIQYPIVVELPPAERRSYAAIAGIQLTPPTVLSAGGDGHSSESLGSVPLGELATISIGTGPSQISRQNKQRRIDINAPVVGTPLGSVVERAQRIMDRYTLPAGYRWQFGPAILENNDTFGALTLVVLLAIALIYMLLASQFESFLDPLIIMLSVPLSLVGIVTALFITHRAFGLTAFIGSLMLVGITVKNAILVIEFTKQLRRAGAGARDALMQAGPMRLRPILMTMLATVGGMLPLALGIEAGSATQAPLATVVIGGLIASTVLSLVVVPTVYLLVATHIEPRFTSTPPRLRRAGNGNAAGARGTPDVERQPISAGT